MKKIAFLTSGGDSPGMNAVIRAIVKSCLHHEIIPFGIYDGYQGMVEGRGKVLTYKDVSNIIQLGGTILGTARSKDFLDPTCRMKAIDFLKKENIDGLIVIGGDGTFAGAKVLNEEMNISVIGIPGTIDNDIYGTDFTIGFDTAINTVISAVDKIRDTATSHHRIFFVEVMGRDAGFIALNSAIASGADDVLIPEEKTNLKELLHHIKHSYKGQRSMIIIVAEGDDEGHAIDILNKLKPSLPEYDLRHSVLGHIQRGGSPSAQDRILATKMGVLAVDKLISGDSNSMIGLKDGLYISCNLTNAVKQHSKPDLSNFNLISLLRSN
ncbi:MAG: 6-phosphofructokinase [Flavobacteriia bacterium]|jgi:6-phosphofructokinase 1